jgi:hypothetical protein
VPHQRDEDVVVSEDLGLLAVELGRPRVAAAASLVVVRHQSGEMWARWATVRNRERKKKRRRVRRARAGACFVERGSVLGTLKWWRGREPVEFFNAFGTDMPFMASSYPACRCHKIG